MDEFDYLISPCDPAADQAAKQIQELLKENPNVHISPRGGTMSILGIADRVKVLKEIRSLDSEQEVIDYYIRGGTYGFVPAQVWLETYKSIAYLKNITVGQ